MRKALASLLALSVSALCFGAQAQTKGGFALDRFDPSERGSDWFALESLDLRGNGRFALGVVGEWAYKPLVIYDDNGDEVVAVVEHQVFAHVGGAVNLFDRLRLAVNLPVSVVNSGDGGTINGVAVSSDTGGGIGDLRLGADLRLVGTYGGPFNLAFGTQVHLPTGNQDAFTGDGKVRVVPRLLAAGDVGPMAYAVRASFNYRAQNDNFGGDPFGSEMGFGAALGVRVLDRKLLLGPELTGSTVVSDGGDGIFERRTTPVELIGGGHYTVADDWHIGLGAGPGLTRGYGTPKVRVLASLEYFPKVKEAAPPPVLPPADRDDDGIIDSEDACPEVPGIKTDDPKTNGCPPPGDRDSDGIIDEKDACPDEKGVPSDDPAKNGCPLPSDRDGDGIIDDKDACPDEKGVASDDPAKNGCPPPKDTDGDGIMDPDDACPDQAGPASPDPKKNGCPKAKVVGKKIEILERVEFDTNKATIRSESDGVLTAVLDILKSHPEIEKVSVEGHTDNRGARFYNIALSKRRAASVVKWLTSRGIDKTRLTSNGFGPDKPIDKNDTADGRQNNRRVEFNIVKVKGKTDVKQ